MQIAFRVDASAKIGTGHVMRCLTLADQLQLRGARCTFIARHLPGYLENLILSKAHQVERIGDWANEPPDALPHSDFLGTSQTQDATQTAVVLDTLSPDCLIIDHYAIDSQWEQKIRSQVKTILVIDDLADRDHDCDLLVDQNLYADMATRYEARLSPSTVKLLGAKYAILRPEFSEARKLAKVRTDSVSRILVFFGGMDSKNFTQPVLETLAKIQLQDTAVDVVIGAQHPHLEQIERICLANDYHCHVQSNKMASLLLSADMAIGAGGSNSWERGCLGLPTLAFVVAPNQVALTLHADHLGLLKAATANIHDADELRAEIIDFLENDQARKRMSQKCLETIDTQGAQRIVDHLYAMRLDLRSANPSDSKKIFEWRNHPSIREISIQSDPIEWETHQQWFSNVLESPNRYLYIAEENGREVGVIRFDLDKNEAEVSLYLAPELKGKGLGTQLLLNGEQTFLREYPQIECFVAAVLENNKASHRLFRRCGYHLGESKYLKKLKV